MPSGHLKLALIFKFPSCLAEQTLSQTHDKTAAWCGITRLWQGLFQRTVVLTSCIDCVPSTHTHTHTHHSRALMTSFYPTMKKNFHLTWLTQEKFVK